MEHEICTKCKTCQSLKRNKKQYLKLHHEEGETIPWDSLCVDLIEKYQFTRKRGGKKFQIVPKKDQKKYKMTTKVGKFIYKQSL